MKLRQILKISKKYNKQILAYNTNKKLKKTKTQIKHFTIQMKIIQYICKIVQFKWNLNNAIKQKFIQRK